jgi:hypothetical protein
MRWRHGRSSPTAAAISSAAPKPKKEVEQRHRQFLARCW